MITSPAKQNSHKRTQSPSPASIVVQQLQQQQQDHMPHQGTNNSAIHHNQPAWNRVTKLSDESPFSKRVHSGRFPLPPDYDVHNPHDHHNHRHFSSPQQQGEQQGSRVVVAGSNHQRSHSADGHESRKIRKELKQLSSSPFVMPSIERNRAKQQQQNANKKEGQPQLADNTGSNNNQRSASAASHLSTSSSVKNILYNNHRSVSAAAQQNTQHDASGLSYFSADSRSASAQEASGPTAQELQSSLAWEKEKQKMFKLSSEQLVRKTMQMHFDVLRLRRKRAHDNAHVYRLRKCREFVSSCSDCVEDVNLRLTILGEKIVETDLLREEEQNSSPLTKVAANKLNNEDGTNNNNNANFEDAASANAESKTGKEKVSLAALLGAIIELKQNQKSSSSDNNILSANRNRSANPEEDIGPNNAEPDLSKSLSLLLDSLEIAELASDKLLDIAVAEKQRADQNAVHISELDEAVRSLQAGRVELLNLHAAQTEQYELSLSDLRIQLQDKDDEHLRATEYLRQENIDHANRIQDLEQVAESLQINLQNEEQRAQRAEADYANLSADLRMLKESMDHQTKEFEHTKSLLNSSEKERKTEAVESKSTENYSIVDQEAIARFRIDIESRNAFDRIHYDFRLEIKYLNDRRRLSDTVGRNSVAVETDFTDGTELESIVQQSKQVIDAVHDRIFALEQEQQYHEQEIGELQIENQFKLLNAAERLHRLKIMNVEECASSVLLKRILFREYDDALTEMEDRKEIAKEFDIEMDGDCEEFFFDSDVIDRSHKKTRNNSNVDDENKEDEIFEFEDEINEDSFFFGKSAPPKQHQQKKGTGKSAASSTNNSDAGDGNNDDSEIIISSSGQEDFFIAAPPAPKWHQVLSEAWAKQPPPKTEQERAEKKEEIRDQMKKDVQEANNKKKDSMMTSTRASTNNNDEEEPDPVEPLKPKFILDDSSLDVSVERQDEKLSTKKKPVAEVDLDEIESEVEQQQQHTSPLQALSAQIEESDKNNNNETSSSSMNNTSIVPPPHLENTQVATDEDRSALDDLASSKVVPDEMLRGGNYQPRPRSPSRTPPTADSSLVPPAPPGVSLEKYQQIEDEMKDLKRKIEKQNNLQKLLQQKLVRSMSSGIVGEREEKNRQEIFLAQYFDILGLLKKYMLAAHQLVGVAKKAQQQQRAATSKNNSRSSSVDGNNTSNNHNNKPRSVSMIINDNDKKEEERKQQEQNTNSSNNNNNTENLSRDQKAAIAEVEKAIPLPDSNKDQQGLKKREIGPVDDAKIENETNKPPVSIVEAPKQVENYAQKSLAQEETTANSAPSTEKANESSSQEEPKTSRTEDSPVVIDDQQQPKPDGEGEEKPTTGDKTAETSSSSAFLPPPPATVQRRDRSIVMPKTSSSNKQQDERSSTPNAQKAETSTDINTPTSALPPSNNNIKSSTSTPSGSRLNTPRASPTRFNEDIMKMLEEARKAFQTADDEASRLLHYLEPSPPAPKRAATNSKK